MNESISADVSKIKNTPVQSPNFYTFAPREEFLLKMLLKSNPMNPNFASKIALLIGNAGHGARVLMENKQELVQIYVIVELTLTSLW